MNRIISGLILIFALYSCKGHKDQSGNGREKGEKEKKVSKRNRSITPANSYSDIFLDSLQLMEFLENKKVNDTIWRRMISFYNSRNYQFAWFTSKGFTEQARGFWNLHQYSTTYGIDTTIKDRELQRMMQDLITEDAFTVNPGNKQYIKTELTLTEHFISYLLNNYEEGFIKRKEMERFIPVKKEDPVYLADSIINKKHKDQKYYSDVNPAYKALQEQLGIYVAIAKKGGWPLVSMSLSKLKPGTSSPDLLLLKKRLNLTGDLAVGDTSLLYNTSLTEAVRKFQLRHGYTPDGKLTQSQLNDMNVPVLRRIEQILVNMGRMEWLVNEPKGQLILVNIPEFILYVKEGKQKVFDMNVVVGKEGHSTTIFTGNLNQVIFSPYWNVPPSIVTKEILPKIKNDPGYLAAQNMEIVKDGGSIPVIRQLPGEKNALGRVKFLFPNSFNIYFHDTPSKSLFSQDKRAGSHGCIRLSEPQKLAEYLLQGTNWTKEKIELAMNSGQEQSVMLAKPVPVLITYYTAWVDGNGLLHFAEDIYDHDKEVAEGMFTKVY